MNNTLIYDIVKERITNGNKPVKVSSQTPKAQENKPFKELLDFLKVENKDYVKPEQLQIP